MKLAVVILNWNGKEMLRRFLPSVLKYSEGLRFSYSDEEFGVDVWVADNGSTDGSLSFLRTEYPQLRLIELESNYGFAGGYNKAFEDEALKNEEYDLFVLLNSDVECTPHWIEPIAKIMYANPNIAVMQPKLLMYDHRDTFEYSGGAGGFIDGYGYPFCRGRLFSTLEKDHGQYDDDCDIFWASGAAMFVRASVWYELGGLDADFFAHMEEIDFCWRVHNAGLRVCYCSQSVLYHVGGGTLPKSSPFKTELNFRNNLSMLYKNLPSSRMRKVLALRMLLDRVAAVKFLVEGHVGEYSAVRKAHRQYREWRKENLREKRRAIGPHEVPHVYRGAVVAEYFLLMRHTFSQLAGRFSR